LYREKPARVASCKIAIPSFLSRHDHSGTFRPKYLQIIHGTNAGSVTFGQSTGERSPDNPRTESAIAILPISRRNLNPFAQPNCGS